MGNEKQRSPGLDLIRAVAISLVLLSHFLSFYFGIKGRYSYPLGVLGVELFFVLSGYLIGGILIDTVAKSEGKFTPGALWNFWIRRWFRTIPNYLLFLLVCLWLGNVYDPKVIFRFLTFTQNIFAAPPDFYGVSWSLAVEEWFYIIFPLLVFAISAVRGCRNYSFVVAMSLIFFTSLAMRLTLREGSLWSECIEKSVAMRLDSLMWGVLAAWLRRYFPLKFDRLRSKVSGISGILMVLITTIGLALRYQPGMDDFKAGPWDMFWFLGFNCGTALALPMFVSMNPVRSFIGSCVEKVSLWSYSMYLCHLPVMVLIAHNLPLKVRYSLPLTVLAIFAISAGLFYCLETPCTRLRDKFHKPLKAIRRTV